MDLRKIKLDNRMNKKGLSNQIVGILILLGSLTAIIFIYFFYSLMYPVFLNTSNIVTVQTQNAFAGNSNLTDAVNKTFVAGNNALQGTKWLSYGLLFGFLMGFGLCCFYVRTYPFLLVFWIVFGIILIFVSIYLTASYDSIKSQSSDLNAMYTANASNDFLMEYLPQLVTGFMLLGGIILFSLISKDPEAQGYL